MPKLSVIILSYNTANVTKTCIKTVHQALEKHPISTEVIVVDNASTDNSVELLKKEDCILVENKKNVGFSKGNNIGYKKSKGEYILFLNSDTEVENVDFQSLVSYLDNHHDIAALTVRVNLDNGEIDPASHRGFPTVWRSFCYFSKIESLTKHIPFLNYIFGGYHLTYLNLNSVHEIDSPTGAFYLIRRDACDKVHGFDEDFFMYGEDIDLSYRLKKEGLKILYYPKYIALHRKYTSGLATRDEKTRDQTHNYFYDAMILFYKKHYQKMYPHFVNNIVERVINWKRNHS